jgi:hypothetical protein
MQMNRTSKGAVIALSVAALFAARGALAAEEKAEAKIECTNDNSCKGKGICASADGKNSCAGHNSCKGHVAMVTKAECAKQGGHEVTAKK